MLLSLGRLLLAAHPLFITNLQAQSTGHPDQAPGRVMLRTDREDPYSRGSPARVYLSVEQPAYVAVLRVDTDGRVRVLFPREPWGESYVGGRSTFEVAGPRAGQSFVVDDYPGIGYLFAVASRDSLDFGDLTRGDYWDYRVIDGGRIQGDPYVKLTDLAARLAPAGDYDYDVVPYYVNRHYDYPRFVCYDCHAYASFSEWDPYRTACTRFRVVVRDDPRYYPYRFGGGRNVVPPRSLHPGPRYLFRDADPRRGYVTRLPDRTEEHRRRGHPGDQPGRTGADVGGRGSVPTPGASSFGRPTPPRSTGEPELRRRRP